MAGVELTTDQVIDLARQLLPERKREALQILAAVSQKTRDERIAFAEQRLRRVASERGLNWDAMTEDKMTEDKMTEDKWEALVDDLIHEDRSCPGRSALPM